MAFLLVKATEESMRKLEMAVVARTYIYHCPAEMCRKKSLRFNGMKNLKQHYFRVHTPKSILCKCGAGFALQKDLLYHQKKRCLLGDRRKKSSKGQQSKQPNEFQFVLYFA
ncbi:hypothetical protein OESDEN_14043 [Oesophagostomum dentatum]|uniref:Zinc finger, C2H2 type n=1 Tax=Oesophagostomum dentatum TaxID=61180 RepID=A0A0B1SQQ9_OESDE|nr:hypothetical protein OESDEN_14043 [Oesophagostomum dentatum]